MKYTLKEFRPGHWWILGPNGHPIYDGAPDGNDSAVIFHDEDAAIEVRDRLNNPPASQSASDENKDCADSTRLI